VAKINIIAINYGKNGIEKSACNRFGACKLLTRAF
jgi:hypothetical protein